ncbi:DUF58 domain-containing protein [Pseudomonas lalucatii]|uniref:DUF58 domain-containing protein n=1 Tax=Pseudomonas lalucatii TaxID=1424203 RepID=A0ABS5PW16_9PSED|nr:DUF58 domain-containing protein [Pseudomonas lalucatii]MBS7660700.1 DUF58 domain-containing protein [Pseudomonas lalucatii]
MIGLFKPYWTRWLDRRIPAASSVRLDQRKIFIRPTRIGAVYVLALVPMLLAAINYQNSLAYGLTFLLGSVFVVAILHTYRNLAGLTLKAVAAEAVFLGEQGILRVRLEDRRRAHQAIGLGWSQDALQLVDVPVQGAGDCELSLTTLRRGWLRPGRLRIESRFPLGILVAWSWVDLDQALLVYPRPLPGELPQSAGGGDELEELGLHPLGHGCDDFQGLRAYQPGDSRQRLHWKAYSRGQGLLIKDFATLSGRDPQLDFAALDGDVETRLARLCHWVLKLSARHQPFALHLPGRTLAADSGDAHRERCLRALALFGAAP